jgi:hypothetical protein
MSIEKAKEILRKLTIELPDDRRRLMYPLSRVMVAVDKALAELEAESKPEPGEFTKKMRMRILRDQPMVDAETASFDQLVVIATEALEHLDEACDLIDSLQEQLVAVLRRANAAECDWQLSEEQLAAKDKDIARLKAALGRLVEYTAQRLSPDEFIRLVQKAVEQALKGGEREL